INSGAPASTAPPDFSSLGMMASHRNVSVAYCEVEKYLGAYFPAGAAAFSLCTIWWTYSAASAGITCSTDPPTARTARVLNMSRLLILSFAMVGLTPRRKGIEHRVRGGHREHREEENQTGGPSPAPTNLRQCVCERHARGCLSSLPPANIRRRARKAP